jgi:hypothetical protein
MRGAIVTRARFHVTYEIVTPESAEHADAAERGYVDAEGRQHELPADMFGAEAAAFKARFSLTMRQAANLFGFRECMEDAGRWFQQADSSADYKSGAETRMAFYPPDDCTGASYQRLAAAWRLA